MAIYRIMTGNLWKNDQNNETWAAMGEDCSAAARSEKIARVFADIAPDAVGLQESSDLMAEELMARLQERGMHYTLLWGRDTPILYDPRKFEVADQDFFIYPETVPGYDGAFNNEQTKSWCAAVLRAKENGRLFAFMTTHIWWMSDDPESPNYRRGSAAARVYQVGLAMKKMEEFAEKYRCPLILVGDLNSKYTDGPVQSALQNGYAHAHDVAAEYASEDWGYHKCFGWGYLPYEHRPFCEGIDHILVKGFPERAVKRFDRYSPDYYVNASDHSPAFIDIEI